MDISNLAFDGASVYFTTERSLRSFAGIGSLFIEFRPRDFIGLEFIFVFLKLFFIQETCCHVGGPLPTYLAWLQTSYRMVAIFMAMKDDSVVKLIFRRREELVETFYLRPFRFTLREVVPGIDSCLYQVRSGLLEFEIECVGIDSEVPCGNLSNVELVHFV
jgi:hypothetical protein